jgi:hypothetical protein
MTQPKPTRSSFGDAIDLTDVAHRRKTGEWPDGKVPRWASEYAAQIGTKAGTAKFDDAIERWYVSQLEAALKPFAEAGTAVDPRTDATGAAATVQDEDGRKHVVTYGHLRHAARLLGEGLRKLQDRAEIHALRNLIDGAMLWQIRWRSAYSDKVRWLLIRETVDADSRRKLEGLGYGGQVKSYKTFQASDDDLDLSRVRGRYGDTVPVLQDQERIKAVASIARLADIGSGRSLREAYERVVSDDERERRYRRKWTVVADMHLSVGGLPGNRLIRLRWTGAPVRMGMVDQSPCDVILSFTPDGDAKVLYGDTPWRPKPGEPTWRVASFVFRPDDTSKLVAGIAAGSTRMIAEALDAVSDTAWMTVVEADRVLAKVLA